MTEREYLLTASAGLLLIALLRHHPRAFARLGGSGLLLLAGGVLIPLLDPLWGYFEAADRIEFLALPPRLGGLFYGAAFIGGAAILAGSAGGKYWAARTGTLLAMGYGLYQLLLVLTPFGAPLLEPFSPHRVMFPILPGGHPVLLVTLVAGLAVMELWRSQTSRLNLGMMVFVALYFLAGGLLYVNMHFKTLPLREPGQVLHIYPHNVWLSEWMVISEEPERYIFRRVVPWEAELPSPTVLDRWNDRSLMIRLLSDPVVRRFQYQVFRHPVANMESTASQITLMLQEVENLSPMVPGRTFSLESDLMGKDRYYQIQRFD